MAVVGMEDVANSVIEAMKAMEREHREKESEDTSKGEDILNKKSENTFSTPCDRCSNQVNSSVCEDCAFYPLSTKDKGKDDGVSSDNTSFYDDENIYDDNTSLHDDNTSLHDDDDNTSFCNDDDETLVQVPRWFMNFVEDEFDSIDEVLGCMLKDIKKLKKKNKGRNLKESKKKEKKREARIERLEKLLVMLYYELRSIFGRIDEIQELYKDVVDDLSQVMIRLRIKNEDCESSENVVNSGENSEGNVSE